MDMLVKVLQFLLIMIMLTSTLYMNYSVLRIISAGLIVALIFSFIFVKSNVKFSYNLSSLVIVILFSITSMLSALVNSDVELMLGASILLIIFIAFIVILPSLAKFKTNELI